MAVLLDDLLLGLVDLLDAFRGHVHRPHFRAAAPSGSSSLGSCSSPRSSPSSGSPSSAAVPSVSRSGPSAPGERWTPSSSLKADGTPDVNFDTILFDLINAMPVHRAVLIVLMVLAVVLVAIFFVTGADSASIVMGGLSEKGAIEPSRFTVVFVGRGHRRCGLSHAARRRR